MKIIADEINEKALIASALLRKNALTELLSLHEDDFYFEKYKYFYNIIKKLESSCNEVSLITVYNEIVKNNRKNLAENFLNEFTNEPASFGINNIKEKIKNLSIKRKLYNICYNIIQESQNDSTTIDKMYYDFDSAVQGILNKMISGFKVFGSEGFGWERFLINSVKTGFDFIDSVIGGLSPANLILIASRPGEGKTALALNIAYNLCKKYDDSVLFFSLEMLLSQLELRLMCIESHIEMWKMQYGKMSDEEKEKFIECEKNISMLNNFKIYDNVFYLEDILIEIKKEILSNKVSAVIIDYLQLLRLKKKTNRLEEVTEISRELKLASNKFKIPIIALAQLNRLAENDEPKLNMLRESGSLEQDADIVLFLYKKTENIDNDVSTRIVAKNRQGRTGKKDILFEKKYLFFGELY